MDASGHIQLIQVNLVAKTSNLNLLVQVSQVNLVAKSRDLDLLVPPQDVHD